MSDDTFDIRKGSKIFFHTTVADNPSDTPVAKKREIDLVQCSDNST